ncbi:hypothetical protein MJO28_001603 [Puccinia striiformis f. sp. tritici]|uniref:PCI domain-containing protein n=2 Tax=Puccinia striiformis f. sp. tritici TaxID=168172 RepID=A0A0L0W4X6_9BASI|nr:hypothetical protein Pst134EB_004209 [Puccinia striiformis f. sp. tritici]KAI7961114.1 hypothetical protein MJO28_001603 [Puccinia striiformis f. sp. tritici]KNF06573.1 hypothetical protein PSTG_00446 [Puccinia striiformis f. sp. tritici PST-78]
MRAFPSHKRKQESGSELEELSFEQLVQRFAERLRHQQDSLSELIRPLDRPLIKLIRSIIPANRKDSLDALVQKQLSGDRILADFLSNYLNYIVSVQFEEETPVINHAFSNYQNQTEHMIDHDNNFDLLLNAYNPASNIFRRSDAAFFTRSIQHLSHGLVFFAIKADREKRSTKKEKASEAARQMTTTLGVACIDRTLEEPSKRRAAFSLANGLFKIYFFLNNMRLCDTVVKNISNVLHQLETHYPKAELVTFHYYLGRLALYQRRLHKARESLKKSFDLCKADSWRNRRLILTYLIVASLPLGILPRPILLEQFQLQNEFQEVVGSLRTGNWPGVVNGLESNRDWFRFKGIYILLREKLEVICWRNFFVIMAGLKNGNPGMRLSLSQSVEAARKVFMEPSIDEDDIVCMVSSLIDQGYLKAYVKLGEMIVFGSVLPQISTVGEHMNEGGTESLPTFSEKTISLGIQPSSDSDAPLKPHRRPFNSRGPKRLDHTRRFA